MPAVRRVYLYLVAFVSLHVAAYGAADLARSLIEALLPGVAIGTPEALRRSVALNGAFILVGLPIWLVHWGIATRSARRDLEERRATLRRLYVYAVLATMIVAGASAMQDVLEVLIGMLLETDQQTRLRQVTESLPWLVIAGVLWAYHQRIAVADRRAAGEWGGSATLRRWYAYGVAFIALLYLLRNAARIVRLTWETIAGAAAGALAAGAPPDLAGASATLLVALALWATHWPLLAIRGGSPPAPEDHQRPPPLLPSGDATHTPAPAPNDGPPPQPAPNDAGHTSAPAPSGGGPGRGPSAPQAGAPPEGDGGPSAPMLGAVPILDQDVRSVLRPVYLFGALAVCVATTLAGLSQLLYYALARLLGVPDPGGVSGNLAIAMAGPASVALVYGAGWLYHRRALAIQAQSQDELPRQAGVRRLYVYLVALLALAVTAAGAGGLLWTLADLATQAPQAVGSPDWWRRQISLYVTLLATGVPVWALHWGPVAAGRAPRTGTSETHSLARRIYLYVALGGGVLALLGSGIAAVRELLGLALGEAATAAAVTNLARALSTAAVAGLVAFYHQRVLRDDLRTEPAPTSAPAAAPAGVSGSVAGGVAGPAPTGAALPSAQHRYGVLYQDDAGQRSEWFATPDDARRAERRLAQSGRTHWTVTAVADYPSPPGAPEPRPSQPPTPN